MTEELVLAGLDGSNPLGFLAGLGALVVLDASPDDDSRDKAALRWTTDGTWRALLRGASSSAVLIEKVIADRDLLRQEPILELRYTKGGDEGAKEAHDLKPPPNVLRQRLREFVRESSPSSRRSLDYAAAFFSEIAVDGKGNIKPTALHFTAGQQEFLKMVTDLRDGLERANIEEALFGPWRYECELPVMGWDSSAARDWALRASDPSKDKKTGVPGADWLAFRGLQLLSTAPDGDEIVTPGVSGGWKHGTLEWPLWSVPIGVGTARSLLSTANLARLDARQRAARGISFVFRSEIRRSDQGGYGSLRPAEVA